MLPSVRRYFTDKSQDLSLLRIFKPVYITLTMFGLFPYCVKFKTKHTCVIIPRTIYLNSLCAVSMTLLITLLELGGVKKKIQEITMGSNATMMQVNSVLQAIFLFVSCVVAYVRVYCCRYKVVNILNRMAALWVELPVTKNHILEQLRSKITFTLILLFIVMVLHMQTIFTRKNGQLDSFVMSFLFIIPQLIHFVAILFYYVLVLMLVALMLNIEGVIKTLQESRILVEIIKKFETRAPIQIHRIELICVRTFEIKREINDAFEATLLVTCMQCFHSIVSESHQLYHGAFLHNELSIHEIINYSLWILYQLIKGFALGSSGSLFNSAVCRIGQALHNIPPEKQDLRAILQIQHFTSMMSFQGTNMTVYGFFQLDSTFLFKILASAAMYLIILVQFDKKS